jgi:RNA polymerase sigma factor (sigma-70 family)
MENLKVSQHDNKTFESLGELSPVMEGFGLDDLETIGIATPSCHKTHEIDNTDDRGLQELIYRIIKQDQSAFGDLFNTMVARVNSMALRITGCVQLAEEVTEDTFFQVWRQAPRFDPARGTATAWILTIARSRALDARRSIPPYEELTGTETAVTRDSQGQGDVPDLLSVIEENQVLHRALERLAPLPRQLIALSFFRGLSHEEIAESTGLPLGTVKSYIRRAVIHLRETLLAPSPHSQSDHE